MKRILLTIALIIWPAFAFAGVLNIQPLKTPKGITVWLVEDHALPITALSFAFHSGTRDPLEKQGVSQLLSNTLDEGAGDMDSKTFQSALRDNAIDLSFSAGRDSFIGNLRTLNRHRDEALRLLKLALLSPRFDAEAVERMKQANLMRIRSSMTDVDWIAARIANDRIYKGHPYAMNTGGTLSTMGALTPQDLREARARHFSRNLLVVGLTGDITKEDAIRIVDDVFGDLPEKVQTAAIADVSMPKAEKPVFYAKEAPQTTLSMTWPGIDVHDPDYYAAVVMDYIFGGGGFASRLMTEVREAKGLTYGIYSNLSNLDHADRFSIGASMLPENVKPTIETVKTIAASMRDADVSGETLQAAKDYLTGSMPLDFSSTSRIANVLVALQIGERPVGALDEYVGKINAVTSADIKRVAARIFSVDPIVVLSGAKPADMDMEVLSELPNTEKVTR